MKKLTLLFIALFMLFGVNQVQDASRKEKEVVHVWTKEDSKAYARDAVLVWADKQYKCLASLWGRESAWEHEAYNPQKVMGKNAGGIPQILGMSPTTPPTMQIDRGMAYIKHRYDTPCKAWAFHKKNGWY